MSGTTTNYGWTYPTSTDYVKDGATAIQTLATGIDTSLNSALGTKPAGMLLLNNTSFSSVTSVSINNVFSTTYKHYVIKCELQRSSSGGDLTMRLRKSGTDSSAGVYAQSSWYCNTSTAFSAYGSGASQTQSYLGTSFNLNGEIRISNPMDSGKRTLLNTDFTAGGSTIMFKNATYHDVADAYDGFTLLDGSAFSGSIQVYGLKVS